MDSLSNDQAEIEVLGRIIREPRTVFSVNDHLTTEDFYNIKNQHIFEAMKACSKAGEPIEIGMLLKHLKGSGVTLPDLVAMSGSVASTSDIKYYVDIVKESGMKRKLRKVLSDSLKEIDLASYQDLSHKTMKGLYDINTNAQTGNTVDRRQLMEKVLDYIDTGIKTQGKSIGMKTGWPILDKALKGFKKGDLVIIGARPSIGKTAFALNLSNKLSSNYKMLFFELEMQDVKLGLREVAARSLIPLNKIYDSHKLTDGELSSVMNAVSTLGAKGNLIIDDSPKVTLDYLRNKIHYIKNTQGVDVVIIDHIGLIKESKGFRSRNEWMGEISSSLKAMAKEFDVNIIALSQLSRGVEGRLEKRPILADLRDSGNLEQDADCVMFLYREGYYKKDNIPETESLEVIIAKNRDGMTGPVHMAINLKKQLVTEIYKG